MRKEEIERIINMGVEREMPISEIAKLSCMSRQSVYKYMKKMGISYSFPGKVDVEKLESLVKDGKNYIEIANMFGITPKAVQYHVNRKGLKGMSIKARKTNAEIAKEENKKKNIAEQEESSKAGYRICKATIVSKTKHTCLYGGKLGTCDCCDYYELTGERRKYEKGNPEHCYCYKEATKRQRDMYRHAIKDKCSDVLIYGSGGEINA